MWNPFKKNKEVAIKVQPPKPVQVRDKLINNGTMKRELNAIRTSSAVRSALGLGASYTGLDINAVINQQLPALMIESRDLALNNPIAKKYFTEGEHWLRFRYIGELGIQEDYTNTFDYIELVPLHIINDPTKPEDRH